MYICTPATFGGLLTALPLLPLQHWPRRTKVGRLLIFACRWMTGPKHEMFKIEVQSNLMIRNFLVTLILFLNAKCFLSLCSKLAICHWKWFLNTNLFLKKPFLITKLLTYYGNRGCGISKGGIQS